MQERLHILKILKKVDRAIHKKDFIELRTLSNKFIHHASIHQDPDVISTAVIIYALSKMIEREDYKKERNWNYFYRDYCENIGDMVVALQNGDTERFREEVHENRKFIEKLSGNLKIFIGDVFRGARINKASRIYEHGISMESTAKILGITVWELAEYAGKTGIGDVNLGVTMTLKDRVKLAGEIFKK